jgi:hypothetical protein
MSLFFDPLRLIVAIVARLRTQKQASNKHKGITRPSVNMLVVSLLNTYFATAVFCPAIGSFVIGYGFGFAQRRCSDAVAV